MRRTALGPAASTVVAVVALAGVVATQERNGGDAMAAAANLPERIWQDPGDVASLDLAYGPGGRGHAPDATGTFTFVSEDMGGTSPKIDVSDGQGTRWKVKLGPESQPETAATRLLWAAGYFTDEDYYLAELTVQGLPELKRGREFVSAGGVLHGARLKRKQRTVRKLGHWDWFDNPFVGQRELNGLRAMMALVNDWDLKEENNAIDSVDGERHYLVSDVGATFGKTGSKGTHSKGVPRDYEESTFISAVGPDAVDLVLHSRPPFLLRLFAPSFYREHSRMEEITRGIPRADARWLGRRLSMLTDDQIREAFRASGYGSADVEGLTAAIRRRITELEAL